MRGLCVACLTALLLGSCGGNTPELSEQWKEQDVQQPAFDEWLEQANVDQSAAGNNEGLNDAVVNAEARANEAAAGAMPEQTSVVGSIFGASSVGPIFGASSFGANLSGPANFGDVFASPSLGEGAQVESDFVEGGVEGDDQIEEALDDENDDND